VLRTGQRLMSLGNDWGQDLRTLAALAATAVVLAPTLARAFRSLARS